MMCPAAYIQRNGGTLHVIVYLFWLDFQRGKGAKLLLVLLQMHCSAVKNTR